MDDLRVKADLAEIVVDDLLRAAPALAEEERLAEQLAPEHALRFQRREARRVRRDEHQTVLGDRLVNEVLPVVGAADEAEVDVVVEQHLLHRGAVTAEERAAAGGILPGEARHVARQKALRRPTIFCLASRVGSMSASRGYCPGSTIRTFKCIPMLLRPARLRSLSPCFQHRLHRNPVLAAALQHGIPVIAAWAFWLVLIRRIHDVHHCLMAHAFALHIDRAPGIKMRKAFVMVERLLVLCADFPQQAVHMVALVGQIVRYPPPVRRNANRYPSSRTRPTGSASGQRRAI